ncbi:MAG: hypothetical protein QOG68_2512 [Solirubrobacteraceae bacterium]|nr:hypothetical protein [Solirubrobacteraceae bacterium]
MPTARRTTLLSVAGLLALGLLIALVNEATHGGPLPYVGRGAFGGLVLFGVTGAAAAARLTPAPLRSVWPVLAFPAGAVLGSLGLTALGMAAVPLQVSLWVVLAGGIAAWWRFARGRAPRIDWWALAPWVVAGALAFLIATMPDWKLNETTIFGTNPDSHQVVGSAVLFQHAPPWATRPGLPINEVPANWRFRVPILYALAGASNLVHFDPIYVFPAMAGLLVALAALGFGALAVCCLRLPLGAGPWVAMATPLNAFTLYMAWHPYYNQLWGLALLPWTLAIGWWAVRERSRSAGIAFVGLAAMLALGYSVAVLYPIVLVAGMAWAFRLRRPRIPRPRGVLPIGATLVAAGLLAIPLVGAAGKTSEGVRQLFDLHANLWGGDIFTFTRLSDFVGTDLGTLGMLIVLAVAAVAAARLLTRREALALLGLLAVCALFDVRLRLADRGQYMDYKHLGYVGAVVLAIAAAGAVALVLSRRRALVAAGVALGALWLVPAVGRIQDVTDHTPEQVTADMILLRQWSRDLPKGASVRVDIPPSGNQLWVQYFLSAHPLTSLHPVEQTTYAHMPAGLIADYVLEPRYVPTMQGYPIPWPMTLFADTTPFRQSRSFVLRRLHIPLDRIYDTSSRLMIQPSG